MINDVRRDPEKNTHMHTHRLGSREPTATMPSPVLWPSPSRLRQAVTVASTPTSRPPAASTVLLGAAGLESSCKSNRTDSAVRRRSSDQGPCRSDQEAGPPRNARLQLARACVLVCMFAGPRITERRPVVRVVGGIIVIVGMMQTSALVLDSPLPQACPDGGRAIGREGGSSQLLLAAGDSTYTGRCTTF